MTLVFLVVWSLFVVVSLLWVIWAILHPHGFRPEAAQEAMRAAREREELLAEAYAELDSIDATVINPLPTIVEVPDGHYTRRVVQTGPLPVARFIKSKEEEDAMLLESYYNYHKHEWCRIPKTRKEIVW